VAVSASYTLDGITRSNSKTVIVKDLDMALSIVDSSPPDGAIDGRQPSAPDGSSPAGWQAFDLTFNGETCLAAPTDFAVHQEGGESPAPLLAGFEHTGTRSVRIYLSRVIEPGSWTTVEHTAGAGIVRVGSLPGDVNSDGTAGPSDILAVIDNLNGQTDAPLEIWQCDVDRSGACAPADILRVIDLLNGANVYEAWTGRSLP
jgi:hypothetical protein